MFKKSKYKKTITQNDPYDHPFWHISKIFRLRFWFLVSKIDARLLTHIYLFFSCFLSIMILGLATYFCSIILIFPSLGPTVFMQYYAPSSPMSSPKHTILGHAIGCVIGLVIFYFIKTFGLSELAIDIKIVILLALGVALCGAIMSITDLLHPPAASTTLLVAFGNMSGITSALAFIISAIIVTYLAWIIHKFSGVKYPFWQPFDSHDGPKIHTKLGKIDLSKKKESLSIEEIAQRLAARQKIE